MISVKPGITKVCCTTTLAELEGNELMKRKTTTKIFAKTFVILEDYTLVGLRKCLPMPFLPQIKGRGFAECLLRKDP